jgi:hypothetical protein
MRRHTLQACDPRLPTAPRAWLLGQGRSRSVAFGLPRVDKFLEGCHQGTSPFWLPGHPSTELCWSCCEAQRPGLSVLFVPGNPRGSAMANADALRRLGDVPAPDGSNPSREGEATSKPRHRWRRSAPGRVSRNPRGRGETRGVGARGKIEAPLGRGPLSRAKEHQISELTIERRGGPTATLRRSPHLELGPRSGGHRPSGQLPFRLPCPVSR